MAPSERGWEEIKVASILVAFALVAVVLRIVARKVRAVTLGTDDYLAMIGMLFLIGMLIELILWAAIGGNGWHSQDLSRTTTVLFFKIFLSNELSYTSTSPVIKLSIVFFYRRIFSVAQFRLAANIVIGLIIPWGVAVFLAAALQCQPLAAYWDHSIQGHCFDGNAYFLGNQIVNIIFDVTLLVMPMPMIWNLQRPLRDKIALTAVFVLGGFACVASIVRIIMLRYIEDKDITYTVYQATLWTLVEPCIGMICGCLPIIRGLFHNSQIKKSFGSGVGSGMRKLFNSGHHHASPGAESNTDGSEYIALKDARDSKASQYLNTNGNCGV